MTSVSRIPRRFSGPLRALGVLWALAVALLTPRAFAAAPMCDPSGASVVAPNPAPPSSTGDWVPAKPCLDLSGAAAVTGSNRDRTPPASATPDVPDRVLPVTHPVPALRGVPVPDLARAEGSSQPGFALPIYHPPR